MKTAIGIKAGSYTAEGDCLDPAEIVLTISDLSLPKYRQAMQTLAKEFGISVPSSAFRKNRNVLVRNQDVIHTGNHPAEGNHTVI
jgi:hypothetical protein